MNQLEIEFKTLLTQEEYLILQQTYHYDTYVEQTNDYFDTPDHQLQQQHMALRIRTFDTSAEGTLKIPQSSGVLEVTEPLSQAEYQHYINHRQLPDLPSITSQLKAYHIPISTLIHTVSLHTKRYEKQLSPLATIMLDESHYNGHVDYELEMEVTDETEGHTFFTQWLSEHHLPFRPSIPKIKRALQSVDSKN